MAITGGNISKYIGRLVNVGVGRETARGGGVAATYEVPVTSFSFDDKVVKARSVGALSNIADSEEAFVTTKYGQGDMEGEIRSKSFGLFLYAMLGTCSSGAAVDSSYTHSFTISQANTHQSLAFVVADSNTTELYPLVMLDSLEITCALDEIVKYAASFMSKAGRDTGLTVPAVVSESKFTKKHVAFRLADTVGALAAATPISIKSLTLTISKNVFLYDVLGTAEPEDILNRQLSVEGEVELLYESETYKNYMKNGTNKCMQISFVNTDDVIGVIPTRPSLTFQFPKVDFFDWAPAYDLDEIVSQKISFKCSRDVATPLDVISTCSLVNTVATY